MYDQPIGEPKLKRWALAKHWTIAEISFLLAGVDPSYEFRDNQLSKLKGAREKFRIIWDLLAREIGYRDLGGEEARHPPEKVLAACDLLEISVPSALSEEVSRINAKRRELNIEPIDHELTDSQAVPADEVAAKISTRRYNTLLRIVGALAADTLGWRPGVPGSTAREIEAATERFGARVSDDTIRTVLAEAEEQLDFSTDDLPN